MMTSSFADELGLRGIRVNAICPGIMSTQMNILDDPMIGTEQREGYLMMIPARRWGEVSDVADTFGCRGRPIDRPTGQKYDTTNR